MTGEPEVVGFVKSQLLGRTEYYDLYGQLDDLSGGASIADITVINIDYENRSGGGTNFFGTLSVEAAKAAGVTRSSFVGAFKGYFDETGIELESASLRTSYPPAEAAVAVLSPHPDDAALSIGGLIQKSAKKYSFNILTLFGRSNYTRERGFEACWEAVTSRRKSEDNAYANAVGARLTYLDFPEASLRVGSSYEAIFTSENDADLAVPGELRSKVALKLEEIRPSFLFAPLGFGGHLDHILTRELARAVASGQDFKAVFYEDLPYAAGIPEEMILEHVRSISPELIPTYVPIERELNSKLDALMLYESQIRPEDLYAVRDYALSRDTSCPMERLWSSAPLTDFFA
ncbi:MAG TPA: PIG-L family deacetylase [Pyrinomonadaceae bacterium]|nr:PIG-L family deacetylase [Pyrinomonadaceae bacterium]